MAPLGAKPFSRPTWSKLIGGGAMAAIDEALMLGNLDADRGRRSQRGL